MSNPTDRPVAIVANTNFYVGPELALHLAGRGFDLVLGDAAPALVAQINALGASVEVVTGVDDLSEPSASENLVRAAMSRFGKIDSAVMFSGQIVTGRFIHSSVEDLRSVLVGCVEAPYLFMKSILPNMMAQGQGQILVITSASAARPTPGAPLYSAARAAATMLVKNVADEVARTGVQVNAVGTNFMDFPAFLKASGANDPEVRAKIESQVPMKRLGTMSEFASFCMAFLDGSSRFTTGQFVAYAGGWA